MGSTLVVPGHRFQEVAAGWVCRLQGGEFGDHLGSPTLLNYKMSRNYKMHLACKKELKQSKITHTHTQFDHKLKN